VAFTAPAPLTIFPATYDRLPYEAKEFVAIGATCLVEAGFVVGSAHPAKTLEEFVKWAKDHPCSIGNPGHATGPHFNVWQFARAAGIDVQHVPYRTIPQLALEVATGQLSAGFSAMPAFMELIKAGRLRLLATAGSKRAPLFPQVSTFAELGYPKVQAEDWYGFVANARVARPFRIELAGALRTISKDPEYRDAIVAMGLIPEYQDPPTLAQRMKADTTKWAELVKLTGFKSAST
jgi:tripartite-type tricarboxylate transporter receptor subunit TctC